ncbi:hypothetical protein Cgig2_018921 [Carnegiea gigantea]|uniref:Nuclear pore complex protein NUP43 n=1 Tax=Carnegiea gigantea TaxID=171969 RepID=A0A9Q1GUC0_9CARY|nr:hypothetical protein Cgig2_018921 [Carnegiea gigantea]
MATLQPQTQTNHLQIHRLPQSKYVDAVRWMPPFSAFDKFVVLSFFDSDSSSCTIEIHSLDNSPNNQPILCPLSASPTASRTSSLKTSRDLIAFSTFSGSLNFISPDYRSGEVSLNSSISVQELGFHVGPISCIDVLESECVSVGEDGRVNLVNLGGPKVDYRRIFDGNGLVSHTAAKWASPAEFATGGLGFSLQWWDQRRKPGEPALQFKGNWWPQQPIVLSGVGSGKGQAHLISESEVWEVQFDSHSQSNITSMPSSRLLPVMMCSEDGILSLIEQGAEPIELLAEPCAINSFDIGKQNHSDIICSLEWESLAILSRP